jgi:hypothetical protein
MNKELNGRNKVPASGNEVALPYGDYYVVIQKRNSRVLGFVMTLIYTRMEMQAFPAADAEDAIRFRSAEAAASFVGMMDTELLKAAHMEFLPFHVTKELAGNTNAAVLFPPSATEGKKK